MRLPCRRSEEQTGEERPSSPQELRSRTVRSQTRPRPRPEPRTAPGSGDDVPTPRTRSSVGKMKIVMCFWLGVVVVGLAYMFAVVAVGR